MYGECASKLLRYVRRISLSGARFGCPRDEGWDTFFIVYVFTIIGDLFWDSCRAGLVDAGVLVIAYVLTESLSPSC